MKRGLKLVFTDYGYCPYIKSKLSDNKSMDSAENFFENVNKGFKSKGYNFNHIADVNILTTGNKMDLSSDIHIKHSMHAVEWKVVTMINKN